MVKSLRLGSALTAIGLIGALAACATPQARIAARASIFSDKANKSDVGAATRAAIALDKGDFANAVALAEVAVGKTPGDAGFRTLLGNAYFGAGRFASAESAYRDSLSLNGNQPQVVLKLALVTIAQGKRDSALALLERARDLLDPADYGLALALAGQTQVAVEVLDMAARQAGADSRVRQNLALANALAGNWDQARAVAAQDVIPSELDGRIQQWMSFAKPANASDQVASLTGIAPAAADPGQPVRLALVQPKNDVRLAEAEPVQVAPVAEPAPPVVEEVATEPQPVAEAAPAPAVYAAPEAVETAEPAAPAMVAAAPVVAVEQVRQMTAAVAAPKPARKVSAKPGLSPRAASLTSARPLLRNAAFAPATGTSRSVVQLGAYSSRSGVSAAWNKVAAKYPALRGFAPATARFDGPRGTVYRLSVSGFASSRHAQNLCSALRSKGGACFVRSVAGDRPVQLASL